jgi:putative transposase
MGVRVAPSSVWAILGRHGIEPTPRRAAATWAEFLRAQATTVLACDFRRHSPLPAALRAVLKDGM